MEKSDRQVLITVVLITVNFKVIFMNFKIFLNITFLYSVNFGIELLEWHHFSVFLFLWFLAVESLLMVMSIHRYECIQGSVFCLILPFVAKVVALLADLWSRCVIIVIIILVVIIMNCFTFSFMKAVWNACNKSKVNYLLIIGKFSVIISNALCLITLPLLLWLCRYEFYFVSVLFVNNFKCRFVFFLLITDN